MNSLRFFLILIGLTSALRGSELAAVVAEFKDPSIETAKVTLEKLEKLIENGDARTVTLSKKVHRSVKRIYTTEHRVLAEKQATAAREVKAKQLDQNGRKWLKPNVHGKINRSAARVAFGKAKALRQESIQTKADLSKAWAREVADFEGMLDDLKFSKELEPLQILADVLYELVKRTPWVEKPSLKYDGLRISFLRARVEYQERWVTLARHAAEAGDLDLSYDLYRKAGNEMGRFQVGAHLANRLRGEGFPGSAIHFWEQIGEEEKAKELRVLHPSLTATSFRPLTSASLIRQAAPACVRVLIPGGHRTGFFYKPGGYLMTCKSGLLDAEGKALPVTVVLENGRKLLARVLGFSSRHDLAALKIDLTGHEILPVGDRADVKAGAKVTLLGFSDARGNVASSAAGAVMVPLEIWKNQPTSRLALDGGSGQRGGPVVDERGRVTGLFLFSKTGSARVLEIGSVKEFLKQL
ncbi:MAG: hypothetical protein ACJAQT_002596 [Akkermansiaceae bacterium]|jgi:hypothetical protein